MLSIGLRTYARLRRPLDRARTRLTIGHGVRGFSMMGAREGEPGRAMPRVFGVGSARACEMSPAPPTVYAVASWFWSLPIDYLPVVKPSVIRAKRIDALAVQFPDEPAR